MPWKEKITSRELPVRLSSEELIQLSREQNALIHEAARMKENKSSLMTKLEAAIKEKVAKYTEMSTTIMSGERKVIVECREEPEFYTGTVNLIRIDTNQIVPGESRPMTTKERQLEFKDPDEEQSAENVSDFFEGRPSASGASDEIAADAAIDQMRDEGSYDPHPQLGNLGGDDLGEVERYDPPGVAAVDPDGDIDEETIEREVENFTDEELEAAAARMFSGGAAPDFEEDDPTGRDYKVSDAAGVIEGLRRAEPEPEGEPFDDVPDGF